MMASYDTNRATFVQEEFRFTVAENATVLARNTTNPRVVEITTNLDEASASALANKYASENATPRAFEIVLEGVTFLSSFVGGVPAFTLNFPKDATDGRTFKVIGFSTDYDANTTTLQVRG